MNHELVIGGVDMDIKVHKPTEQELKELGVREWPIWQKEESVFKWHYDQEETCFILEGDVEVKTPDERLICLGAGDMVVFPRGFSCIWHIKKRVKKHYNFS